MNFNRIVPGTIRSILEDKRPIIRSDGKMIRDYFYIEDGAEAYMLLAEKMTKEIHGEAFNFSHEEPMTVLEIVDKISKAMKSNLKPMILNESSNEIKKQYLSAQKAREILGWNPLYTMEEGLQKTISWYRDFLRHRQ